jgi:hypothetical protein
MSRGVRGPLAAWFLAGCGLIATVQLGYLARHDWDATILLQVGAPSPARRIVERELGPVAVSPGQGHDGKYFYLVARHPWFWTANAEQREGVQDPAYRYGRPLYPLLAGLGGTLPPFATFAGLVIVQVLAGGLYITAVALLARHNGLPPLAVFAAFATPCLYSSAVLLTSDLLALALTFLGVYCWQRGRLGGSVALFAAAVLAKEYYALTPLMLAATTFRHTPRSAIAVGGLPLVPLVAWRGALAAVFGIGEGGVNFSVPGEGLTSAAGTWDNPALGVAAVLLVAASLAGVVRASRPLVRWQCGVWGLLGLCASSVVWHDPADILRVISPAWWFAIWCWYPVRSEDET